MSPHRVGGWFFLALLVAGCKGDAIHVDCTQVCTHVVEVTTRSCTYNCGDSRARAMTGCLNGECPLWTPVQADCMIKAQDVAAFGLCAYQR
jgi:hypothetical protein